MVGLLVQCGRDIGKGTLGTIWGPENFVLDCPEFGARFAHGLVWFFSPVGAMFLVYFCVGRGRFRIGFATKL